MNADLIKLTRGEKSMIQKELIKLTGVIVVKTGLHIGTDSNKIEIGGMDNPIVRNPLTQEPYIPGSSIKGKMRSLLEWELNKVKDGNGDPCHCDDPDCEICRVFGSVNKNADILKKRGPTRIIVRDATLTPEFQQLFKEGKDIVEEKSENAIDRITAKANPRSLERVVPGVKFNFEILYRVMDTGDEGTKDKDYFTSVVIKGLKLLKDNYLGGGGSRGNGRIDFENVKDESGKDYTI